MQDSNNSIVNNPIVLNDQTEILSNQSISRIRPMYQSNNPVGRWKFPLEIQKKIRSEQDPNWRDSNGVKSLMNFTTFVPYVFLERNLTSEVSLSFPCICKDIKNINCISSACRYKYCKNSNNKEYRFKDGLEILDIPSTMMLTIEKRNKEKLRKKRKMEENHTRLLNQIQQYNDQHPANFNPLNPQLNPNLNLLNQQLPPILNPNGLYIYGNNIRGFNNNITIPNRPDQFLDRKINDN